MKSTDKSTDLVYGLDGDPAQALCLRLCLLDGSGILERAEANQQRRHQLTGFVVQLASNPAAFLFLRLKHTLEQKPTRRLRLLQSANFQMGRLCPLALADVATDDGNSDDVAIARTYW